jgi:undecaprenyl-diphosphatase
MPPPRRGLDTRHAILLGLLEGPTELLPISSSAHTSLVPLIAGWPYAEMEDGLRKSFEVSLHAGAALALAIRARHELRAAAVGLDRRAALTLVLSCAPPACAGFVLQEQIERRLGGPRATAGALALGALAMALADRRSGARSVRDAGVRDALAIGLAQALALIPGVSRNGAALAAARARRFERRDAAALSWRAGLPVMLGASLLSAVRTRRRGLPPGAGAMLAAGGGAAFCSTLASTRLLCVRTGRARALLPYALYRLALAALVAARLRGRAIASGNALQ